MPIYDYTCSECHRRTEFVHGINDSGPQFCPACGAEGTLTKMISAPSFHFKGTGWAKKDRGSAARSAARANDSDRSASTDGAGDTAAKAGSTTSEPVASTDTGVSTPAADPKSTKTSGKSSKASTSSSAD